MYPLWRAFSKSSIFAVHTTTGKQRFPMYPLWRAFSKSFVFLRFRWPKTPPITVDERPVSKSIRFQTKTDYSVECGRGLIWNVSPNLDLLAFPFSTGPFLKVSLMLNRKQVKKIKTSVKPKTLNPVYNEAFIFDVPPQHISNVNLYARVVNDREDQQVMGKIIIGPNAKSIMGVHHWECMLLSPRKPIAQWHTMKWKAVCALILVVGIVFYWSWTNPLYHIRQDEKSDRLKRKRVATATSWNKTGKFFLARDVVGGAMWDLLTSQRNENRFTHASTFIFSSLFVFVSLQMRQRFLIRG